MECNRDEAVRAKAIAESKLEQKDYVGAKKFALKAQTLFPGLNGISQMLTTLDVYVCAENKIGGEVDWYGVLNVNPTADDDAIRKQYRKLALLLHPDKNRSIGADGAFQLISEAWSLLGDKAKRLAYNQRSGFRVYQPYMPTYTGGDPSPHTGAPSAYTGVSSAHTSVPSARPNVPSAHTSVPLARPSVPSARPSVPSARPSVPSARPSVPSARPSVASAYTSGPSTHTSGPTVPPGANPFFNFTGKTPPIPRAPKKGSKTPSNAAPSSTSQPRNDTFWTICKQCNMQYEYLKIYRNYTLLCPNCRKPFMALETAAPVPGSKPKPPKPSFFQRQQSSNAKVPSQNANDPVKNVSAAQKSGADQAGPSLGRSVNNQQTPHSGTSSTDSDPSAKVFINQVQTKVKRSRGEPPSHVPAGNAVLAAELEALNKKRKINDDSSGLGTNSTTAQGNVGSGTASASGSKVHGGSGTASASGSKVHSGFGNASASGLNAHGGFGTASASGLNVHGGFGTASVSGLNVRGGFGTASASGSKGHGGFGTASAYGSRVPGGFGTANASGSRFQGFSGAYHQPKPNSIRELTPKEIRTLMIAKAQNVILKRLSEWKSETSVKPADKDNGNSKEPSKETHRNSHNSEGRYQGDRNREDNKKSESSGKKTAEQAGKSQANHSAVDESKKNPESDQPVAMSVPDADFHDFDKDRTESAFAENEVWVGYDDDDGMPRFYALISKVISRDPFKLKISWLNSKTNTEFSDADWIGSGFYKTCGEFRVGKYVICTAINAFSQKVNNWSKGPRGSIQIFPQKGDVWALYRNWSSDWNEHTPDDIIHKYDMVVVLDDYSEENGVSVAPLVKVVGFKTVFCQNSDSEAIMRIPRQEMFRFSHQVPHHLLASEEAPNTPNGCLELDPAATPLELLQVITETNEAPAISGNDDTGVTMRSAPVASLAEIDNGTNGSQALNGEEPLRGEAGGEKQACQGEKARMHSGEMLSGRI